LDLVEFAGGKSLIAFDTKETVIELNSVKIEAFPSLDKISLFYFRYRLGQSKYWTEHSFDKVQH
jgi:hypothetical protein